MYLIIGIMAQLPGMVLDPGHICLRFPDCCTKSFEILAEIRSDNSSLT